MDSSDNSLTAVFSDSDVLQLSKSQKKKARKKQKKVEQTVEVAFEIEEVTEEFTTISLASPVTSPVNTKLHANAVVSKKQLSSTQTDPSSVNADSKGNTADLPASDTERDIMKRVRALRKKLKQIAELERKIEAADINPLPEQLTKLATKEKLQRELDDLTSN